MTITVDWDSPEQKYLITHYYSGWSLADFRVSKQETDIHLVSVDYLVDILVIFHEDKNVDGVHRPPSLASVGIAKAFETSPTNLNHIYVVNAGSIMTILIKIIQRLAPNSPAKDIQFIETLAQATEMIENNWNTRHDETNVS